MRCPICNTFNTGGSIDDICDTCANIIASTSNPDPDGEEMVTLQSVIPSETDSYGRVKTHYYE
jgi:hypothetical protein